VKTRPRTRPLDYDKTCVAYYRVSTKKQADGGVSIPEQRQQCHAFAASKGLQIEEEYVEEGRSATTGHRPEFQRMLANLLADPPQAPTILVYNSSRFYRDEAEAEVLIRRLGRAGVIVRSVTQDFGVGPAANFARRVSALVDEEHSVRTAIAVKDGMNQNARQGFWNGTRPPFGYRAIDVERRGPKVKRKLAVFEPEAEIVRLIYGLADEGDGSSGPMGIKNITQYLNHHGRITEGRGSWYSSAVHRILHSEAYIGTAWWGRTEAKSGMPRPESEWVAVQVPPIIDAETYARVQDRIRERRPDVTPPRITSSGLLLGGIARCAACGSRLKLSTGKSHTGKIYRYYACSARQQQGTCSGPNSIRIGEGVLNEAVLGAIAEQVVTAATIESVMNEVADRRKNGKAEASDRLARLKHELENVKRKQKNMLRAVQNDLVDDDDLFREEAKALKESRRTIEHLIQVNQNAVGQSLDGVTPGQAGDIAREMRQALLSAHPKVQRQFLRGAVASVFVEPEGLTIVGPKDHLAELAAGQPTSNPSAALDEVRISVREWRARQGSNLQPPA
jgi:site-specific DNA recombinase